MSIDQRLNDLGLQIPDASPGKLAPAVRTGNLVYTSGACSAQKGKLGTEVTVDQGYAAAKDAILQCLGSVQWLVGDLNKVTRVVKLLGMVNCGEGFSNT